MEVPHTGTKNSSKRIISSFAVLLSDRTFLNPYTLCQIHELTVQDCPIDLLSDRTENLQNMLLQSDTETVLLICNHTAKSHVLDDSVLHGYYRLPVQNFSLRLPLSLQYNYSMMKTTFHDKIGENKGAEI